MIKTPKKIGAILLSMGGVGYSPVAPGTVGSLVSIPLLLLLRYALQSVLWFPPLGIIFLFGFFALLTMVACLAIRETVTDGMYDKQWIVLDEFLGMAIALSPIFFMETAQPVVIIAGFILFRIFDIWKPLGIRRIDAMNTPVSVILDDIVAGALTLLCLYLAALFLVSRLHG
ncbi:MAG: p [Candidatus Peribacteria bacterium]|nr:p [Candidatus Peribacteria bacterium]